MGLYPSFTFVILSAVKDIQAFQPDRIFRCAQDDESGDSPKYGYYYSLFYSEKPLILYKELGFYGCPLYNGLQMNNILLVEKRP